jgi:iron complex outermembrane recepter protein
MFKRTKIAVAASAVLGGISVLVALPALAQETQRIEITGSSIKRVDAEGSLPVTVVTREDIVRSGVISTEQLVQSLSAVSSQGSTVGGTGAGASTAGQSTISLRGLFARRTLVLVNGRRLSSSFNGASASAAINVNTIPLSAIERVEVLKDGASSIYGSDALAGVVNFILTKDFQGVDIGVLASQPTRKGGGDSQRATLTAGFGSLSKDRFNITLAASVEKEKALFAEDRDFAATGNQFPFIVAGATGQGNIEGFYQPGTGSVAGGNWVEGTVRTGFGTSPGQGFGNPLAAQGRCGEINMFLNPTPTSKGAPYCTFDSAGFVGLIPKREAASFTLNGAFRVSNQLELFGDAFYAKSTQTQQFQPSPVRRSFLTPSDGEFLNQGVDPALLIYPSNPAYQTGIDYLTAQGFGADVAANAGLPFAVTARVFDFGLRTQKDKNEQTRLVLGARGDLAGQSYELAFADSKYKLSGTVPNGYFSQVAYARAVQNSPDFNPWSLQLTDAFKAAIADAKYTGATLDGTSKLQSFDGKLTGDVLPLTGGFLSYAVGAQYRKEAIKTEPSDALFSGDIAGLGGATPPIDRNRNIKSVFVEAVAPVLKNLELNAAGRQDRYNDVGNASTYKASARFQPVRQVVLRGSIGTGFRAPLLGELWLPQTVGTSAQFTDPAFPNNPNLQVPELSGGNPSLKPEKSKQTTIGVVLQPTDSFGITLDYWRMTVEDLISTPSTQEIVSRFRAGDAAFAGLVDLNAAGEVTQTRSILSNLGTAKLAGIDVDMSGRFQVPGGRLDIGLNGTYMIKFDQTSPSGAVSRKVGTMVEPDGTPVIDSDSGGVILRWKHRLAATYSTGPWAFTVAQNYYTGYRTGDRQLAPFDRNFVPDQMLFDASVFYTGIKNLRLGLGIKNVFDEDPPIYVPVSNQFQAGYDINLYDPRARTVFVSANYKF